MIEYRLLEDFPDELIERVAGFYLDAGWISASDSSAFLKPALTGSFLVAGAFDKERIVGIARVLSDGCSDAYIQDVTVDQAYRGMGIGGNLIKTLVAELKRHNVDWIGLVGEPGTESFYQKLGWQKKDGYSLWKKE